MHRDDYLAFVDRHEIPVPPDTVLITANPDFEAWIERTAIAFCTDRGMTPDHEGPRPCVECLRRARALAHSMSVDEMLRQHREAALAQIEAVRRD